MTVEYRYMRRAAPEAGDDNSLHGRAWPYGSPTMIGKGPYGFREVIKTGAGKKSINDGDIVLLDNHQTHQPLARMSAGTLVLTDGSNGGDWNAKVTDTSYARDVVKNVRAGNYGGCSFGFEVIKDKWTDDDGNPATALDGTNREIVEMKVHEISVCTFPAYGDTTVSARAQVNSARGVKDERAAAATYGDLATCGECGSTSQYGEYCTSCGEPMSSSQPAGNYCSSCGSEIEDRSEEHVCENRNGAKKPYGDVKYADPGYQKDGKKRYPLNSKKRAKAAWSYINQGDNAAEYTAQQLASIKSKIRAALTQFGVKIGDEKKTEDWQLLCDFREMTEGQDSEGDLNDVSFGVGPGAYVRADDANKLAQAIKAACDAPTRMAAIDLAGNLGLADLLPEYWGPAGQIGAVASDDAVRDMTAIYEAAVNLPPTDAALTILNRAEPYLSELTRAEAEAPDPEDEPDAEWMKPENMQLRFEEAKARLQAIDRNL
jgi:HK97 family phage prohead protease